jgi:hypothetical protein
LVWAKVKPTATDPEPEVQRIGLIASLRGEWLKLLTEAMREVGPAAQTLGGLLAITNKETFSAVARISKRARVPLKTARNHLVTLEAKGWITNAGRERTRRGAPRRTCTLRITKKTTDALLKGDGENVLVYGILPWWACCKGTSTLRWSSKALLSIIMARLAGLTKAAQEQGIQPDAEVWGEIANMGDYKRFRFSLARLERITGLSRDALVGAKRELASRKIIKWSRDLRKDGGWDADILMPSENFTVAITPAGEGRCFVRF